MQQCWRNVIQYEICITCRKIGFWGKRKLKIWDENIHAITKWNWHHKILLTWLIFLIDTVGQKSGYSQCVRREGFGNGFLWIEVVGGEEEGFRIIECYEISNKIIWSYRKRPVFRIFEDTSENFWRSAWYRKFATCKAKIAEIVESWKLVQK